MKMDIAVVIPTDDPKQSVAEISLLDTKRTDRVRTGQYSWNHTLTSMVQGGIDYKKSDLIMFVQPDVEIKEKGWDLYLTDHFRRDKQCGLASFSGWAGLGHLNIYKVPFEPAQLDPIDYYHNMDDTGFKLPRRIAKASPDVLIFTRRSYNEMGGWQDFLNWGFPPDSTAWDYYVSCRIAELNYHTWYLPVRYGLVEQRDGVRRDTAVAAGDISADTRVLYERFREVLPIRTF